MFYIYMNLSPVSLVL